MPQLTREHYDSEVKSLAEDIESSKNDIARAEEEVLRLKAELLRREEAYKAAVTVRNYHYPQQKPDFIVNGIAFEAKSEPKTRHKLKDYVPLVMPYLQEKGSTHYKDILQYLSESMSEDMGEHQVYKALRRIIDHNLAPIQQDPTRKGFFMLRQGDTGTPSSSASLAGAAPSSVTQLPSSQEP